MPDAVQPYLAVIRELSAFLDRGIDYLIHPESFTGPPRVRRIDDIVGDVAKRAAALELPPAAKLEECPREQCGLTGDGAPPGSTWRVVALVVFDPMMRRRAWPLRWEERAADGWIERGWIIPTAPYDRPSAGALMEIRTAARQWEQELATPFNARGVRDTAHRLISWEDHRREQEQQEACQYFARHGISSLADPSLTPARRLELGTGIDEIRERYGRACVTPYYVKTAIDRCLKRLDFCYLNRGPYGKPGPVFTPDASDLRVIAGEVMFLFRMALPLNLADAPDVPTADLMQPTHAYSLLEKLRKSCIRRMEAAELAGPLPPTGQPDETATRPEWVPIGEALEDARVDPGESGYSVADRIIKDYDVPVVVKTQPGKKKGVRWLKSANWRDAVRKDGRAVSGGEGGAKGSTGRKGRRPAAAAEKPVGGGPRVRWVCGEGHVTESDSPPKRCRHRGCRDTEILRDDAMDGD